MKASGIGRLLVTIQEATELKSYKPNGIIYFGLFFPKKAVVFISFFECETLSSFFPHKFREMQSILWSNYGGSVLHFSNSEWHIKP